MITEQLDALSQPTAQTAPLSLASVDALTLANEVAEHVNDTTRARCEVSGEPVRGWWDESALRRALENLALNAVKYGDGKLVSVNVAQTHGRVILSVHNCGNPIPDERRKDIFEYLNRGEQADKTGWGIGLPFVQDVARRHGGTVVLDSSAQGGTTFTIDIPVDAREFDGVAGPAWIAESLRAATFAGPAVRPAACARVGKLDSSRPRKFTQDVNTLILLKIFF